MQYSLIFLLINLSAFYGWRYSKTSIDPDWAYFNLWGLTGSVYGRDFADCKTPGIHLWYYALSKLVGKNIARIKFANHFLVGSMGAVIYLLTGNFWAGLAYTVLVNSEWLLSFHGNVGQLPALFGAVAIAADLPYLWVLAVFVEPKLVLSVLFTDGALWLLAAGGVGGIIALLFFKRKWFALLWESSVVIPARIGAGRKGEFYSLWFPWFTSEGLIYLLPWLGFAVLARPDIRYWLPAIFYVVFIFMGKVVRQNHFLPLIPWIIFSGINPQAVIVLALADFISCGAHFGNIWNRTYGVLDEMNDEAEKVGKILRQKPGSLFVNGLHSGIYIHADKPVPFGYVDQVEIRDVARERRESLVKRWQESPPDWVVVGESPGIKFVPNGYRLIERIGRNLIYKKV